MKVTIEIHDSPCNVSMLLIRLATFLTKCGVFKFEITTSSTGLSNEPRMFVSDDLRRARAREVQL